MSQIPNNLAEHYRAVLADLQARKTRLIQEASELDPMISLTRRLLGEHGWQLGLPMSLSTPQTLMPAPASSDHHRFGNISVRWSVLWYLSELEGFTKASEITRGLKAGGYKSDSPNFGNIVAAVLSGLKTKGEVESSDLGYRLTASGHDVWSAIKSSAKFQAAVAP